MTQEKPVIFIVFLYLFGGVVHAQVSINNDNSAADNVAMLEVKSSNKITFSSA